MYSVKFTLLFDQPSNPSRRTILTMVCYLLVDLGEKTRLGTSGTTTTDKCFLDGYSLLSQIFY